MAILEGLKLASFNDWCLSKACSDAYYVVCQVNQFIRSLTTEGVLIKVIKEEFYRHDLSSILFTLKSTNIVANSLARKALCIPDSCLWITPFPIG